jgi:hypothetical protein
VDYSLILDAETQALLQMSNNECLAIGKREEMTEAALQARDRKNRQLGRVQILQELADMPPEEEAPEEAPEGEEAEVTDETPVPPGSPDEPRVERDPPRDTGDRGI